MRALILTLTVILFCLPAASLVQAQNGASYHWERPQGAAQATLHFNGPRGIKQFSFTASQAVSVNASALPGDGTYRWELVFAPAISASLQAQADELRAAGDSSLPAGWPQPLPVSNGILHVQAGQFASLDLQEIDPTQAPGGPGDGGVVPFQVIAEDLIVQGSECVGTDCAAAESFGFDTLRLKENNLRIHFDDTSNSGSFPDNDWRIAINDTTNGGGNYFAVEDATAGRTPFLIEAGAINNALYVDSDGDVGIGTFSPVVELHAVDGNTPTLRLEQNGSNGFTAYTFDIAANETNFFVRDVNTGRLPFKIRPGAGESSVDIDDSGNVGFGVANASSALHIRRNVGSSYLLVERVAGDRRMELDNSGNLYVGGTITQLSSKHSKENFAAVAGSALLAQLRQLDLFTWNYRLSDVSDRHLGPVAEDFYRVFGLGTDERSVAPADMAGVALAASQALTIEIEQRDQHISELEGRIAKLEAALERITSANN